MSQPLRHPSPATVHYRQQFAVGSDSDRGQEANRREPEPLPLLVSGRCSGIDIVSPREFLGRLSS